MRDIQQIICNETDLLKARVTNLYNDCYAKIINLIETSQNPSIIDIIEEQIYTLNIEVTKLEDDFKHFCINLSLKQKK